MDGGGALIENYRWPLVTVVSRLVVELVVLNTVLEAEDPYWNRTGSLRYYCLGRVANGIIEAGDVDGLWESYLRVFARGVGWRLYPAVAGCTMTR